MSTNTTPDVEVMATQILTLAGQLLRTDGRAPDPESARGVRNERRFDPLKGKPVGSLTDTLQLAGLQQLIRRSSLLRRERGRHHNPCKSGGLSAHTSADAPLPVLLFVVVVV